MAENPLVRVPAAWPVLHAANGLRRRVVGRVQAIDQVRWGDVPYAREDLGQRMHIWELNDLCPRDGWPAVLLVHGGGWVEGSWRDFESLGPALARRGFMVCAMDYRLAPDNRWPAALEDVLEAVDFLLDQQVDPERIAIWGHSAGGHLALMAALSRPANVRCAVAFGAPTDLELLDQAGQDDLDAIFDRSDLRAASPLHMPCEEPPPMLHVHGTADHVVDIAHARRHAALRPDSVALIEVQDGDHGMRWPPFAAWRARRRAIQWMQTQLAPASRRSKWKRRKKKKKR